IECVHNVSVFGDVMGEGGLSHMRFSISDTAEYGDYTRGQRIVDEHVREAMGKVLGEIQDGTFAREWIAEMDSGEKKLEELRRAAADQLLENVGRELRALMQTEAPEAHGVR